jgi:hypothetical protein
MFEWHRLAYESEPTWIAERGGRMGEHRPAHLVEDHEPAFFSSWLSTFLLAAKTVRSRF